MPKAIGRSGIFYSIRKRRLFPNPRAVGSDPIAVDGGIGRHMGTIILAETGDLFRFDPRDKFLAYVETSPCTY